jgi:hypothetical protein
LVNLSATLQARTRERHQGGANNWGHVKRIAPTNHAAGDGFGTSVAVERDRIIGASPFRNEVGTSSGAVFVFERHAGGSNQWAQTTKYLPDPGTQTSFGTSVALRQNTLAAGAPFDANLDTGTKFGTVYIYRYKFNNAPMLVSPIADQIANVNEPFNFSLAAGTFADPDLPEWLTLGAASTNGAPLPAWLHFNAAQALFSGTSLVANAGAFAVTVTATDDDGESASDEFVIEVRAGALAAWRAAQFGADANDPAKELTVWGDLVDRDGDGLVNLAEYALGLNPNASDAPGGVTIARLPSGKLAVTHQRRTDDAMLVYTLEGSVDFSAWTNAAALVEAETTSTAGANVVRVKLELNGPATQSGLRYFRVKITRAP